MYHSDREKIKVTDSRGFHYDVEIRYEPHFGLAFAYFNESIIADVQYGRITQPISDDDSEWDRYQESCVEFSQMVKSDLCPKCKNYFDLKK